jgi:hypothetical protein
VITSFPPKNPSDLRGDLGKFSNKINEIYNELRLFLISPRTAEEKAGSVEVAGRENFLNFFEMPLEIRLTY